MVEHRYQDQRVPNTGVLMVRATRAADDFLGLVWDQARYIDHPWWENAAVIDLLGYRLSPCNPERPSPHRKIVRFIGNEWTGPRETLPRPVIRHYANRTSSVSSGCAPTPRPSPRCARRRNLPKLDRHLPFEAPEQAEAGHQDQRADHGAVDPVVQAGPFPEEHDLPDRGEERRDRVGVVEEVEEPAVHGGREGVEAVEDRRDEEPRHADRPHDVLDVAEVDVRPRRAPVPHRP